MSNCYSEQQIISNVKSVMYGIELLPASVSLTRIFKVGVVMEFFPLFKKKIQLHIVKPLSSLDEPLKRA